jgi:hypothetical protein
MMSNRDRQKKDGREKSHDKQAMREGAEFQKRKAKEGEDDNYLKNEHDIQAHKPGHPADRTRVGAR